MMIHRHGIPHEVRFDWRGAFFWCVNIMLMAVIVGLVK